MKFTHFHPRNLLRASWWGNNSTSWYGMIINTIFWCTFLSIFPSLLVGVLVAIVLPVQAYYAARSHVGRRGFRNVENNVSLLVILLFLTLILIFIVERDTKIVDLTWTGRSLFALAAFWGVLLLKNIFVFILADKAHHDHVIKPAISRSRER